MKMENYLLVVWLLLVTPPVFGVADTIINLVNPSTVKQCGDPEFICEIGIADAEVWWTLNGTKVTDTLNITILNVGNGTAAGSVWKLLISCAQSFHTGTYTCNVKINGSNEVYAKSVFFRVTEPLRIISAPMVKAQLGESVVLNCTIVGYSVPRSIEWNKNGTKLESGENINISQRVVGTTEIGSYLEVRNLTESYLGPYTCRATTTTDYVSSEINILNRDLFQPKILHAELLSPYSVKLHWNSVPLDSGVRINFHRLSWTEFGSEARQVKDVTFWDSTNSAHYHQYTIDGLSEGKNYSFKISACNFNIGCGAPSSEEHVVLHGYSSPPLDVIASCHYDNISLGSYVDITWNPPIDPKDTVVQYKVQLIGFARFVNPLGRSVAEEDSPIEVETPETTLKVPVAANTNYTVQMCAITGVGCGNLSEVSPETMCSTPPSVPADLPYFELKKAEQTDDCRQFKLNVKRITERHGPIRCYVIVLYKMKHGKQEIPLPQNIDISSYDEVHKDGAFGAYIAEAFAFNWDTDLLKEITLGDAVQSRCEKIHLVRQKRTTIENEEEFSNDDSAEQVVNDGELAPDTYYSGFVEVKVTGKDGMILTKRSSLFLPVRTGYMKYNLQATALGVICGLLIVIIILVVALCSLSKRNNFMDYERGGGDGGRVGFRQMLCGVFNRSRTGGLMGTPVLPIPDIKPLRPENMPSAFLERHKDSDLLFQREFESLPEQFRDRSSRSSDMLENFFKNRYPDIKAYDQTRVKISAVDGVAGSDYINANYVMGYKDRKKFICAQGPLDRTVNDFWRMIWEQKVEIIVMVTGLEENGKMKCAKYWPDQDEKKYGNVIVTTGECNTYADYAVRKFTVSQKKDEENPEVRHVLQFHYLTWKDFLAPEHPGGILKFVKRINEACGNRLLTSADKGPIVVHCSAGVGRTGTLVVIDSLLQQMKEEGQVEIYNLVVGVRRQRNFLVQSLKQYIFLYRALMEYAQFGETEIHAKDMPEAWKALQSNADKLGKSLLQVEYEKLNQVIEDPRTTDIATTDVNANKNKCSTIVPYDRNRVILTPVPSREHSTYINASFIQGYDRTDTFIITQDPLECTVNEFWRMVHEQSVATIVMLSQETDLQYWPDDETDYDHIQVTKVAPEESGSPHFERREFTVTNTKSSVSHNVIQLHLRNCETAVDTGKSVAGVPASTAPTISLVEYMWGKQLDENGPTIVHCSNGGDGSSTFVACSIILSQLKWEQRVDVFQIARHMRSQRPSMLQHYNQYQFCYKVAAEFAGRVLQQQLEDPIV